MGRREKETGARRISPVHHKELVAVFVLAGWRVVRSTSHTRVLAKSGNPKIVSIPTYQKEVLPSVVKQLLNKAGISRAEYFEYLDRAK